MNKSDNGLKSIIYLLPTKKVWIWSIWGCWGLVRFGKCQNWISIKPIFIKIEFLIWLWTFIIHDNRRAGSKMIQYNGSRDRFEDLEVSLGFKNSVLGTLIRPEPWSWHELWILISHWSANKIRNLSRVMSFLYKLYRYN